MSLLLVTQDRLGKGGWNLRPGEVEARRQEGHFLLLSRDHRGEISLCKVLEWRIGRRVLSSVIIEAIVVAFREGRSEEVNARFL